MRKLPRHARRSGVILMVVLALLTLFAIVGLTFVAYSEKQAAASLNWRDARWFNSVDTNLQQAQSAAPVIQRDLLELAAGDRDFSASHKELDALGSIAAILQTQLLEALQVEQGPKERCVLEQLSKTVQQEINAIKLLDWLIRQLELSPKERPT